ncbi:MAG TPA: class I SAM-dependent methyltransferase [Longimicrobiaceae bacterium]|nr:class I SAM-dependent methyltransferase [Longimicrobiaceae bacterium]
MAGRLLTSTAREYAGLAATYDNRWRAYIRDSVRETTDRTDLAPTQKILDLGTGTGALLEALLARDPTLCATGVDPSPEMLEQAKAKLPDSVELVAAPARNLPFQDDEFDAIVSSSSLHFWTDREAGLKEAHRVLKPGGCLVLTDWCGNDPIMRIRDGYLRLTGNHHPSLTQGQLEDVLTAAGFDIRRIDRYRIAWNWALMTALASKPNA